MRYDLINVLTAWAASPGGLYLDSVFLVGSMKRFGRGEIYETYIMECKWNKGLH